MTLTDENSPQKEVVLLRVLIAGLATANAENTSRWARSPPDRVFHPLCWCAPGSPDRREMTEQLAAAAAAMHRCLRLTANSLASTSAVLTLEICHSYYLHITRIQMKHHQSTLYSASTLSESVGEAAWTHSGIKKANLFLPLIQRLNATWQFTSILHVNARKLFQYCEAKRRRNTFPTYQQTDCRNPVSMKRSQEKLISWLHTEESKL